MDVGLPHRNGFEVVRSFGAKGQRPTLMLTAGTDRRPDHGLDSGADDYLTKPFEADELVPRVRALLRRAGRLATDRGCTSATWSSIR